jgi:hypothetical protein
MDLRNIDVLPLHHTESQPRGNQFECCGFGDSKLHTLIFVMEI